MGSTVGSSQDRDKSKTGSGTHTTLGTSTHSNNKTKTKSKTLFSTSSQKLNHKSTLTIISAGVSLMSIVWNSDKNPWNNIQNLSYLTNSQLYYIVLIIIKCTILFICLQFIAQYFIRPANLPTFYSHQFKARIPGIKHKKNQMDQPSDPLLLIDKDDQKYDRVPKTSIMKRDTTLPRNKYPYNRCSMICRCLCTSNWTLYNWMCIPVILFHLFHVVILINSFWCKKTSNEWKEGILSACGVRPWLFFAIGFSLYNFLCLLSLISFLFSLLLFLFCNVLSAITVNDMTVDINWIFGRHLYSKYVDNSGDLAIRHLTNKEEQLFIQTYLHHLIWHFILFGIKI